MEKKKGGGLKKRYNVEFAFSGKKPKKKIEKGIEISIDISLKDEKKIKEIIETKPKFRSIEHFIQVAVRNLSRKELAKRTMNDVKVFSEISKRMKIGVFLLDEKQKVTDINYAKIGNLVKFQLFKTKDCSAIVVDEGDYNYSLASEIVSDSYYCYSLHAETIEIKKKEYLIYFYHKGFLEELSDEEAKDKLLKAALEFRMKTIDGFLTNAVSFLFKTPTKQVLTSSKTPNNGLSPRNRGGFDLTKYIYLL